MPIKSFFAAVTSFIAPLIVQLISSPACAAAEALPTRLVCYSDVFPPYVMQSGATITGADVDIIAEASRRIGVTIEFRRLPWERLKQEAGRGKDGDVACVFALTRTPEREPIMDFGNVPLHMTAYSLFVRDADAHIRRLLDLQGKAIGVRRGFRLPSAIETGVRDKLFRIEEVDNDETNFRKMLAGRVAAVLTNLDVGRYVLHELGLEGVHPLDEPLLTTPTFLVFIKGKPTGALLPRFDETLRTMQNDGTYRLIYRKYMNE